MRLRCRYSGDVYMCHRASARRSRRASCSPRPRESQSYCHMNTILVLSWLMSIQIAVRLPDSMVEFLDRLVAEGQATSRASVVERALAREFRRQIAARDAAILAEAGADPDMDSLADYAARAPLDVESCGRSTPPGWTRPGRSWSSREN